MAPCLVPKWFLARSENQFISPRSDTPGVFNIGPHSLPLPRRSGISTIVCGTLEDNFSVVPDEGKIDAVVLVPCERTYGRTVVIEDMEVVFDVDRTRIEEAMMVRAKADDVAGDVWSIVWFAEPTDVGALSNGAFRSNKLDIAHLASMLVNSFYGLRNFGVAVD